MQPINDTTYQVENTEELVVKVGDEKQDEALPRVKLEAWQNEANLSVGVVHDETIDHTMQLQDDKIVWQQGDTTARFYNLNPAELKQDKIEFINEGECTAQRIAATYEVDRYHIWQNQTIRLHWANELSIGYYGFYPASEFIDPSKIDIPEVRIAAANWNDPMTLDPGLPLICVHYIDGRDDLEKLHNSMVQAVTEVLDNYGIEVLTSDNPYKLYFQDGNKKVKFFSTAYIDGNYYFYINIDHDYNTALKYHKDADAQPRNDQYAHGLKAINPAITNNVVVEVINRYAEIYGLPLETREYTPAEEATIAKITEAHTEEWVQNAVRNDVYRLNSLEQLEKGLEFDITLESKPDSNIYPLSITTKNLTFYKQDEIPAEKRKEDFRSPRVVNSYAVYHNEKQNNKYKTGKAFHIYRPIIIDANGKEVWGDMEIDTENDLLNIIIPQDFLDNATYPITIDPTFGYTTIGASSAAINNYIKATDATLSSLTNISGVYCYTTSAPSAGITGIYDNAGNLLNQGNGFIQGSLNSWLFSGYNNLPTLPAATYRLAVYDGSSGGYSISLSYDTGSGTSYSFNKTYDGTMPANMASFTEESSRKYSIYAFGGYQYPINVGNSTAMAATQRYQPIDTGNATAWSTTNQAQALLLPAQANFHNLAVTLGTAPGVGTNRAMTVYMNGGASSVAPLAATIADTATTASDNTDMTTGLSGTTVQLANVPTGTPASTSNNKWRIGYTSDYQFWMATSVGLLSTTANRYLGVQDQGGVDTGTAAATSTMPNDTGVLQNFICRLDAAISAGSYTVTLVKNGSDTAAVMTVTSQTATYTGSTISVTNGDTLYWKIVPSTPTAPSAQTRISISCEYVSNTAGNGVQFGGDSANVSGTTYSSSFDVWNATEANINAQCYQHTITALRVDLSAAPSSTNTRTITTRKNASGTAAAITLTGTATTGSWSGTLSIANDDLLAFEHTSTGTPTASNMKYAYVFSAPAITAPVTGYYRLPIMGVG